MKKIISLSCVVILVIVCFSGCSQPEKYISVGTGSVMGVYYPLGGAMSTLITNTIDGYSCSAESTGGAIENATLIVEGGLDLGFIDAKTVYDVQNGNDAFAGKDTGKCLALFSFFPEVVQIVSTDKNIKTVEDLRGKRVAVGQTGTSTQVMAKTILELYGMTYEDIKADYLGFSDAASGMKDNTVDVAFTWAGIPTASVQELGTTHDISIINFTDAELEKLMTVSPYCVATKVTKDHYSSLCEEAQTFAIPAIVCASADLPEAFVYDLMVAVFNNVDVFAQTHERGGDLSLETALNGLEGANLHPGAIKFYKEKGIL